MRIATVGVVTDRQTDRRTDRHTDTGDFIICPMICHSNGTDNKFQSERAPASEEAFNSDPCAPWRSAAPEFIVHYSAGIKLSCYAQFQIRREIFSDR